MQIILDWVMLKETVGTKRVWSIQMLNLMLPVYPQLLYTTTITHSTNHIFHPIMYTSQTPIHHPWCTQWLQADVVLYQLVGNQKRESIMKMHASLWRGVLDCLIMISNSLISLIHSHVLIIARWICWSHQVCYNSLIFFNILQYSYII